jgi:hypothetical protein
MLSHACFCVFDIGCELKVMMIDCCLHVVVSTTRRFIYLKLNSSTASTTPTNHNSGLLTTTLHTSIGLSPTSLYCYIHTSLNIVFV